MAKKSKKEIQAEKKEEELNELIVTLTDEEPMPREEKQKTSASEQFDQVGPKTYNTKNHDLIRGTQVRIIQ